ncbi:MAG: DUF1615 family protein [Candidatus Methylumidiphilus sp.]
MVRNAQPGVAKAAQWAEDIVASLAGHRVAPTAENACAVVAVIGQESSFRENPAVPGLGKKAAAEISALLDGTGIPGVGGVLQAYLEDNPAPKNSFMDQIRAAKTEKDLDMTYRKLINNIIGNPELSKLVTSIDFIKNAIEEKNKIKTIGAMQVSVRFAVAYEEKRQHKTLTIEDIYRIRDQLYTRKGGIFYGVSQLLGYDTGYGRKLFRFADYNAGRYSSRNAALQKVIATLAGAKLQTDGDLLLYDAEGRAQPAESSTEQAIQAVSMRLSLGWSAAAIRDDLSHEKENAFKETRTYKVLRQLYQKRNGEPAYAIVPDITLHSPKIRRRMTTADFAHAVDKRYQACMRTVGQEGR